MVTFMNKKLFTIQSILLCKYIWVYSQSIGLGFGLNINSLETNINNLSFTEVIPDIGYNYQIKYIDKISAFSWELGLGIVEKNYSINRIDKFSGIYYKYQNTYLQLPIKIHYNLLPKTKVNIYINIGGFCSYWLSSQQNGTIPNVFNTSNIIYESGEISQSFKYEKYKTKYKFNPKKDNRIEFGISSGIQITFIMLQKYYLFFGFNYYRALTDQQKEYMLNQYKKINYTFSFEGGLMFNIRQKQNRL
jgi:hypothetical protein